jgi:RNA polymerase sigma factor (sigma-70 family)
MSSQNAPALLPLGPGTTTSSRRPSARVTTRLAVSVVREPAVPRVAHGADILSSAHTNLTALLARKLGDRALAEDLVQQAMAESLAKLAANRIADPSRLAGYVYRVAINLLRNHRRKMDNRTELRAGPAALDNMIGSDSPMTDLVTESAAAHVRDVVAQLAVPRDREIVKRFYLDEEAKEQICSDLGLTGAHFDKVIFRARRRMRALLDVDS